MDQIKIIKTKCRASNYEMKYNRVVVLGKQSYS